MVQIPGVSVHELDKREGREMVEHLTRQYLNMGLNEFMKAWDAGEFDNPDRPEVMHIAMLLPFVRDGR